MNEPMKSPKLINLIYLPVGLLAILVAISLVRSWKEIQSDGLSHQEITLPVSASGNFPGTASLAKAPVQTVADPVPLEKPAVPSRLVERSQFQGKAPIPVATQPYSPPSVPNIPPVQVSMVPTGISPSSQSSAISSAPASSGGLSYPTVAPSSRSFPTSYAGAASSGSYGGSFIPAVVAPPAAPSAIAQPGVGAVTGGSPTAPAAAAAAAAVAAPTVTIPAAFADPAAVGISTPDQTQQLAQIADNFTSTVQNSGVSPSSPGYQNVWNTAAQQANAIFRQQFGYAAFEAAQMNANSQ